MKTQSIIKSLSLIAALLLAAPGCPHRDPVSDDLMEGEDVMGGDGGAGSWEGPDDLGPPADPRGAGGGGTSGMNVDAGAERMLPASTFTISPGLADREETVTDSDGVARPVGAMRNAGAASSARYYLDEVVVQTADPAVADAVAARWDGAIRDVLDLELIDVPVTYRISVDLSAAPVDELAEHIRTLGPALRGDLEFSSEEARALFAIVAFERSVHSVVCSPNMLLEGADLTEAEMAVATRTGAPFADDYLLADSPIAAGVVEAWDVLLAHDKLRGPIKIMIADGGFRFIEDNLPERRRIFGRWGVPNAMPCTNGSRSPNCTWHGANVVSSAMGHIGSHASGPAAPVAELIAVDANDLFALLEAIAYAFLGPVADRPNIVNMSGSVEVPAIAAIFTDPILDTIGRAVRDGGILMIAAAGNEHHSVDEEDCFLGICWEGSSTIPCEIDGVVCVGSTENAAPALADYSNWGEYHDVDGSVAIYAPPGRGYQFHWDGRIRGMGPLRGTSYSSPFVAGVAALVWAADPSLNAHQVTACLLESAHNLGDVHGEGGSQLRVDALAAVKCGLGDEWAGARTRILAPGDERVVEAGGIVSLLGISIDADGHRVPTQWFSHRDGPLREPSLDRAVNVRLSHGAHRITAIGASRLDTVNLWVENDAPEARIVYPLASHIYYEDDVVPMVGHVNDTESLGIGDVSWRVSQPGAALRYPTGLDRGFFGARSSDRTLFPGVVPLAFVADDGSHSDTARSSVRVLPVPTTSARPTVRITAPVNGADHDLSDGWTHYIATASSRTDTYLFEATASDPEDGVLGGESMTWVATNLRTGEVKIMCEGGVRNCSRFEQVLEVGAWDVTVEVIDSRGVIRQDHIIVNNYTFG